VAHASTCPQICKLCGEFDDKWKNYQRADQADLSVGRYMFTGIQVIIGDDHQIVFLENDRGGYDDRTFPMAQDNISSSMKASCHRHSGRNVLITANIITPWLGLYGRTPFVMVVVDCFV
jgi:hypothetical protein